MMWIAKYKSYFFKYELLRAGVMKLSHNSLTYLFTFKQLYFLNTRFNKITLHYYLVIVIMKPQLRPTGLIPDIHNCNLIRNLLKDWYLAKFFFN